MRITVVYAVPERQVVVELDVAPDTSVAQAVARSQLPLQFPQIATRTLACAIFGRPVSSEHRVCAGDRIEILRPLLVDPKEGRRQAAARGRGRTPR